MPHETAYANPRGLDWLDGQRSESMTVRGAFPVGIKEAGQRREDPYANEIAPLISFARFDVQDIPTGAVFVHGSNDAASLC